MDQLVAAVPAVNQIVPARTVTAVAAPVAAVADQAAGGVAAAVLTPVGAAVPVLDPVLQPAKDLVTGARPLPLPLPGTVPVVVPSTPDVTVPLIPVEPANPAGQPTTSDTAPAKHVSIPAAGSSGPVNVGESRAGALTALLGEALLPAAPGSGSGSSQQSSGSSGPAALLSSDFFPAPPAGAVPARGPRQHAPSPVSLDPGSSPD
ncbi:hypothetical protein V3C33_01585 [Micrococcaceae bacterium Sec5.7]